MVSCAVLERPGTWRVIGITVGLLLAFAPAVPLLFAAGVQNGGGSMLGGNFGAALGRSFAVAAAVALLTVGIGLPTGVLAGLSDFPLRSFLLALLALPLLVPSFLWAIGISMLRTSSGMSATSFLSGYSGAVIAFVAVGLPLVFFVSLLSTRGISRGQADAARLAGGESNLFRHALRSVSPTAALAGVLGGVLTLADPGPGQILGYNGAGFAILTSFAAQYDFGLAARQCLMLSALVVVIVLPVVVLLAPRFAASLLARDVAPLAPIRAPLTNWLAPVLLFSIIIFTVVLPATGLIAPVLREFPAARVAQEVRRTLPNTLVYAAPASGIATILGFALALIAGRERRLRAILLAAAVVLFALPSSFGALGILHAGSAAPAGFDFLFRSKFAASAGLAMHCLPLAVIVAMRSIGTTSPSWANAAAVHGVPLRLYFGRILVPHLLPAMLLAALLCALIATADVSTILLLHPPGETSLPLAIFTVMANAPESLVGALCLAYLGGAAVLMCLAAALARFARDTS